ncbi:MAG: YggS family pyridoxal phosphate-dependent enzyme [Gemmatimonadetes bacterium]|nr:YggS family pyridoxal phosphate-dependent enzyme [Gemmatimonadota bacterium]
MWDSRLEETLPAVRDRIGRAVERGGWGGEVRIVAVTKGHPPDAAAAAVRAGLGLLGENRVQELGEKVGAVGRKAAEWHLIGHLQRNKARQALELFDLIQSVDSPRLARTLAAEAERAGRVVRGLLQVNVSGEETKGGYEGGEVVDALGSMAEMSGLRIHGLMTMAPWTAEQAVLRRTFGAARRLLEDCLRQVPAALHGSELSMGMSNDFEIAIEEGATMVRLGTVLFGERQT